MITCAAPAFKFLQANVMHDPDSENVNRLWSDRPQPSGDANITEPFNPEHIFRDARTVYLPRRAHCFLLSDH